MRGKRIKEEKSHNVGKSGKRAIRHGKAGRRKRMTAEERSAQVDKEIRMIVLLVIVIVIGVVAIFVCRSRTGEKEYGEQNERCENGEYVGEREIYINELSHMEMEEEELPESDLYEKTKGMSGQDKFRFYKDAVRNTIYPENIRSSDVLGELSEEDQAKWNALYSKIEIKEGKKGDSKKVADLVTLSSAEYWELSSMCYESYCICPRGDMATRYARNAGDAMKTGLDEGVSCSQLIVYLNRSYEGYVTSFHYRDCEQKLADGCYWTGDDFYQFLYHFSELAQQEKEHYALIAYFYAFYGNEVSGEEGVQHRNDLIELKEETSRILIEEYDYPAFLFIEG